MDFKHEPLQESDSDTAAAKVNRRHEYTEETKARAVHMYPNENMSGSTVAAFFGCSRKTVVDWAAKWESTKSFTNKTRSVRPRKLSRSDTKAITDEIDREPRLTAPQLAATVQNKVSTRAISRTLKREKYTRKKVTTLEPAYPTPNHLKQTRAF